VKGKEKRQIDHCKKQNSLSSRFFYFHSVTGSHYNHQFIILFIDSFIRKKVKIRAQTFGIVI